MPDSMTTDQWHAELEDRQKQRDFERYKFDREMLLKEKEAKEKDDAAPAGRGGLQLTAAQATVAGALFALLGGMFGAVAQWKTASDTELTKANSELAVEAAKSRNTITLERQKFETTLILKAVESDDENERTRNLQFFLKAGFISDPDGKIARIKPEDYPSNLVKTSIDYSEQDLSDPVFSTLPKPLLDLTAKFEGPRANAAALRSAIASVDKLVTVTLNDNQRSALASLIYNAGVGRLSKSTLLADINAGNNDRILDDFMELAPKSGPISGPLQRRRKAEAELFLASAPKP